MSDLPLDRCRDSLHVDPDGLIHRVYREPSWLDRSRCWPPDDVAQGETLCGMIVQQEAPSAADGPTCMACVSVVDADVFALEIRHVRNAHEGACRSLAEMYQAATGRVGLGPVRGVMEDVGDVRRERDELRTALKASEDRCRGLEAELRRLQDLLLSA